jgi:nitrogen regulatory protein PII
MQIVGAMVKAFKLNDVKDALTVARHSLVSPAA